MAKPRNPDDALWSEALDLLIRLQSEPDNPVARSTTERWLARGAEHRRVWSEALRLHELSGAALAARSAPTAVPRPLTRRRLLAGGGAALAAGAAGAAVLPGMVLEARADVATDVGEHRSLILPDGTAAELGPDSALAFHFSDDRREVELLRGMAFFAPAGASRDFVARKGAIRASTSGGAFEFREEAARVTTAVASGAVTVAAAADLRPGDWRSVSQDGAVESGRVEPDQIAAWRSGRIFADREPLAAVAQRIGRWTPARVAVAGFGLGDERISGVFDPSEPLAALEAAVAPLGGAARALTPWLIVLSRF